MIQGTGDLPGEATDAQWRPTRHDRVALGRQTSALLRDLGDEAMAVASSLEEAGVRGQPADARQCAMAMYLRAVMQGDPRVCTVRVFHDRVVVGTPGRVHQRRVVVPLPAPIRAFVAGFDAQRYPSLIRRRAVRASSCLVEVSAGADAPAGQVPSS